MTSRTFNATEQGADVTAFIAFEDTDARAALKERGYRWTGDGWAKSRLDRGQAASEVAWLVANGFRLNAPTIAEAGALVADLAIDGPLPVEIRCPAGSAARWEQAKEWNRTTDRPGRLVMSGEYESTEPGTHVLDVVVRGRILSASRNPVA